jgi:hypothetical protein
LASVAPEPLEPIRRYRTYTRPQMFLNRPGASAASN